VYASVMACRFRSAVAGDRVTGAGPWLGEPFPAGVHHGPRPGRRLLAVAADPQASPPERTPTACAAGIPDLEVAADSHEQYPWPWWARIHSARYSPCCRPPWTAPFRAWRVRWWLRCLSVTAPRVYRGELPDYVLKRMRHAFVVGGALQEFADDRAAPPRDILRVGLTILSMPAELCRSDSASILRRAA
jgi:hypothetical protein